MSSFFLFLILIATLTIVFILLSVFKLFILVKSFFVFSLFSVKIISKWKIK